MERRRDGDGDLVKWEGRKQGMMKASGREGREWSLEWEGRFGGGDGAVNGGAAARWSEKCKKRSQASAR
jgi:hypothetical protein